MKKGGSVILLEHFCLLLRTRTLDLEKRLVKIFIAKQKHKQIKSNLIKERPEKASFTKRLFLSSFNLIFGKQGSNYCAVQWENVSRLRWIVFEIDNKPTIDHFSSFSNNSVSKIVMNCEKIKLGC